MAFPPRAAFSLPKIALFKQLILQKSLILINLFDKNTEGYFGSNEILVYYT
jgi:hypothetical protein